MKEDRTAGIPVEAKSEGADGQVVVYDMLAKGPIRCVNGVNGCPIGEEAIAAWKAAEMPFARTHDLSNSLAYGGHHVIDVPGLFPDFDADENDPENYDFENNDVLMKRIRETGAEPFYRLGCYFENRLQKRYTVYPPKDFRKWARICEHIIAHYNEGWADGFRWNIRYWEIWNEPDLNTAANDGKNGSFWRGTRDQFKELWKTALIHLKKRFGDEIKVGGCALCGNHVGDWGEEMVKEFAAEKVPLDFYSWHGYRTDPRSYIREGIACREMLDKYGYVKCESIQDEWNYVRGWDPWTFKYSREVESGRFNQKGAAFLAAGMACFQDAPVDIAMFYDARQPGMNNLFESISGLPMRGFYPFLIWNSLRKLGTQVVTKSGLDDVYAVAARGGNGKLGIFVIRYDEDNNVVTPIRVTVRLASKHSLANARLHLTDDVCIHTARWFDANADGSIDIVLRPNSFAFVES